MVCPAATHSFVLDGFLPRFGKVRDSKPVPDTLWVHIVWIICPTEIAKGRNENAVKQAYWDILHAGQRIVTFCQALDGVFNFILKRKMALLQFFWNLEGLAKKLTSAQRAGLVAAC